MELYSELSYKESLPSGTIGIEDDEQGNPVIEDYAALRYHKRIERNPSIASRAKKIHGYTCQACGFKFEDVYTGVPNARYIEAHHLVPIALLKALAFTIRPSAHGQTILLESKETKEPKILTTKELSVWPLDPCRRVP